MTTTYLVIGLIILQLVTSAFAYRGWEKANLLRELILASPTVCMACGDPQMGHQTYQDLNLNRYIEPHEFIPVQAVYVPDKSLQEEYWKEVS